MPTANRRRYIPRSIRWWQRQTYPNLELVVLDDGDDPVADLMPDDPRVRYIRMDRPEPLLGRKRNLVNKAARGEFIVHWDDDDWYAPGRVAAQVAALGDPGAKVSGFAKLYYYDSRNRTGYCYTGSGNPWLGAIAYRRSLWFKRRRFEPLRSGSDMVFVQRTALSGRRNVGDAGLIVATIDGRNVSPKQASGPSWRTVPLETLQAILGPDWDDFAEC
jgi:glycosyltransferase involved in cell wall biosynthesis